MIQSQLRILSDSQLEQIHEASVSVLAERGVRVQHPRVVEMLLKEGCQQGSTEEMVRFPKEVVDHHLERARAEHVIAEADTHLRLRAAGYLKYLFDDSLGRTREAVWTDLVPMIRVAEAIGVRGCDQVIDSPQ